MLYTSGYVFVAYVLSPLYSNLKNIDDETGENQVLTKHSAYANQRSKKDHHDAHHSEWRTSVSWSAMIPGYQKKAG